MFTAMQIQLPPLESTIDVSINTLEDVPTRKKGSHGRKLPVDHIPRPRNAFILFRTNFVEESKLTRGTEADNRNISKIAGAVWRALPPEERLVWHKKATEEKELHKQKYPNYKYAARYRPVLRRENVHRRKVKQKLWEGIDSDEENDLDLAEPAPPSASANLPPVDFTTLSDLQRLNDFKHEGEDLTPLVCAPWSTASTSLSLPATPTLANSYETPPSSLPSMSPESSTLIPLPSSSTTSKPRDRCDVIAELYAKGWRGEELEAEVRRREVEGRRRRGVDAIEESKPATVLTMSKAKVRDMERKIDQEAKDKKALLLKAAMESSRPPATKRQRLDVQSDVSSKSFTPVASPLADSPFESPNLYPLVPPTLSPPLAIQAYPLDLTLPPWPTEEPLIPLCQPSSRGRDTHEVSNDTSTDRQQPHHHYHEPRPDLESDERLAWFGHQQIYLKQPEVYLKQPTIGQRGHKRKRSISQPSSPSELNRVYAQLGVQTVYPQPYNVQGWIGASAYPPTQPNWLAPVTQHHPPSKPASPSAQSAPDVSADSSSHGRSSAQRANMSFALRPTRSLPEDSMQEGSKWDQACRRWEDRGGPLNFGSTVYHIARPSEGVRTLDPELHGNSGGTIGGGNTPAGLGPQQSHHGPGVQWNTEGDGHSASFAPIDIGAQYTFSPEYVGRSVAKSWTGSKEDLRHALVSALIELEAESDDLSPEQLMLMTPSQSSEYFGHSSQSIPPSDSSMMMAAEFGGHELGLGLVYAAQSPAESSF
ncbi:hypothetical protein FS837_007548 [Tulasnella sp. UAMH 9824]|nr:hypothetical protein FS837_007548 [Tulasnella sp. UAMH 9824]